MFFKNQSDGECTCCCCEVKLPDRVEVDVFLMLTSYEVHHGERVG